MLRLVGGINFLKNISKIYLMFLGVIVMILMGVVRGFSLELKKI